MAATTRHQNLMDDPVFGEAYKAGYEGRDCPPPPNDSEAFRQIWDGYYRDGETRRRQNAEYQAANPPPPVEGSGAAEGGMR